MNSKNKKEESIDNQIDKMFPNDEINAPVLEVELPKPINHKEIAEPKKLPFLSVPKKIVKDSILATKEKTKKVAGIHIPVLPLIFIITVLIFFLTRVLFIWNTKPLFLFSLAIAIVPVIGFFATIDKIILVTFGLSNFSTIIFFLFWFVSLSWWFSRLALKFSSTKARKAIFVTLAICVSAAIIYSIAMSCGFLAV